jgi:integrase
LRDPDGRRRKRFASRQLRRGKPPASARSGFHEARHTAASLLIAAGLNAKTVSAILGHASIAITFDRYGHLFPGSEDEARALIDAYLERNAEDAA